MTNQSDNLDAAAEYTQADTDAKVAGLLNRVREAQSLPTLTECRECGETIPEARQRAVKGVQCCAPCQQIVEKRAKGFCRG